MAVKTKEVLKGYFYPGAHVSAEQFYDLIDSMRNRGEMINANEIANAAQLIAGLGAWAPSIVFEEYQGKTIGRVDAYTGGVGDVPVMLMDNVGKYVGDGTFTDDKDLAIDFAIINGFITKGEVFDIFTKTIKNLINKDQIVAGKAYSPNSNTITNNINSRMTDFIPVIEGETYTISGFQQTNVVGGYFDANKQPIQRIPGVKTFTVPTGIGIRYIVANVTNTGQSDTTYDTTAQIEVGDTITGYAEYQEVSLIPDSMLLNKHLTADEILEDVSHNLINPDTVRFGRRYSPANHIFDVATAVQKLAVTDFIPVEEGQSYVLSGAFSAPQNGAYLSDATENSLIQNIDYLDTANGIGKFFSVPMGLGIKYVAINVIATQSNNAIDGVVQMELGQVASPYKPFELVTQIKSDLLPQSQQSPMGVNIDATSWFNLTEGVRRDNIIDTYMPKFKKHYLLKDKDLCVVNTGTSLTARSVAHCSPHPEASQRPPLMDSMNMPSLLWDKMKWDNQFYRRYDSPSFFTEVGSFTTTFNDVNWDDGAYRNSLTRFSTDSNAKITFTVDERAYQFNFIYRTDSAGTTNATVHIAEGNGKMEVYDEIHENWQEANGFVFSMKEDLPVLRDVSVPNPVIPSNTTNVLNISSKSNTTYQKRLKMRCKSDNINSLGTTKTISIQNGSTGRLLYWGVEWSRRQYMITFINAARGSHSTDVNSSKGLPRYADNEVWGFKPDLIFSELGIHNDGVGGNNNLTKQTVENLVYNYVVNEDYELSMVSRSQASLGYIPEIIMFGGTITYNFGGISDDGELNLSELRFLSPLDKYNIAYTYWIENLSHDYGYINYPQFFYDACIQVYGDMKTATLGSGQTGNTVTDEGSHPNDTGSRLWAKALLGCFDFT